MWCNIDKPISTKLKLSFGNYNSLEGIENLSHKIRAIFFPSYIKLV